MLKHFKGFFTDIYSIFYDRLAMDQLVRLKNLAARLGTPESEFRLTQVDAPPPDPLEAENVTIAAFQSRQNVRH